MKKIIIILIVTLNILAQEGDWKQFVPEYNHILFPTDVTVIKVDRFNNKWIGTSGYDNEYGTVGGLVKFDGENWTQYTQTNSDLPDGYITAIGFDDEDNTWIGMKDSGIVMIDNGILSRIMGPQNIIQKGEVKSIVTDKAGNIWVLYRNVTYHSNLYKDSALLKFDGNIWSDLKLDSLLPQGSSINEITISKDGKLYCGSYEKVFIYNYMSWSEIQTPVEENVVCLEFDRRHNLWIGTTGNTSSNIWKYENNIWEKPGNINTGGKPSDLLFEKNGNIWISSNATNKGLVRYSGIIWDYLNTENSPILSSSISSIAQDSNGVIWFGSFYGACTYDENIWKYYAVSEGLPGRRINKIVVDDQNNKWIGTNKYGLVKFDGNRWTFFNMSNSIVPHNQINDITIDSIGKIWIATKKGFLSYHNEIWNAYIETNNERVIGEITKVECSPNGELWTIIKYDTLLCFNGTDFTEFHSGNSSLPENSIFFAIGIDDLNNVWLGTDYGLYVKDNESWINYNTNNSELPDDFVLSIEFAPDNNVWIGTENGILRIKNGLWEVFNTQNSGISGNSIEDIIVDSEKNIWVGHYWSNGISTFNGISWSSYNKDFWPYDGITVASLYFDKYENLLISSLKQGLIQFNKNKIVSINIGGQKRQDLDIGVNIFPNPFNNQTSIELRLLSNSIVIIKIYDISGSLIKTNNYNCKKGNNKLSLIFDDYASGIFFVKFFVKSYSVNKERIILKKIIHLK